MLEFDFNFLMGVFWIVCGLAILGPALLISLGGRADLHVHYDDGVDPAYVSRWGGSTAVLMGLVTIGYGFYQIYWGYEPMLFGGLLVALLVLSQLTKRFAQGWGTDTSE
ncbi:hypothetical protein D8Y22_20385 [Salinadaptatus halalkaliphilus]|uniref:DUF3784 domain-containing protein n=1 Tax=Salinadaptatus halalkaliphilus TaxID=2419781 RepID=A0A4S3TG68_9EURY|nr:hypothetical protein [Salinadaptatus halalkaliphilus]THE62822.1 hypothetical protein D8Y22_20385 [Salinadaptatus halalkaliphilus]